MEWLHSKHNELAIASLDGNIRLVGLGQPNLAADAQNASRLMRPGHPEGLQEAVANLYCGLADMMLRAEVTRPRGRQGSYPRSTMVLPGLPS
jgi:hypothetical protein